MTSLVDRDGRNERRRKMLEIERLMRLCDGDAHQSASTIPPDVQQIAELDEPDNLDVDYDLNFSICAIKKRATGVRRKFQVSALNMSAR